ncbi:hypothetical protein AVEN_184526-1, partial [Araneus ventricosus]
GCDFFIWGRDKTPPHVQVPDAMKATEPVGWVWGMGKGQYNSNQNVTYAEIKMADDSVSS